MTADHTPERLSAEERRALAQAVQAGYSERQHVLDGTLLVAAVERILAAHLADVEARLAAVEALLDHAKAAQEASPARLFGGGLFPALISADALDRALHPRPERGDPR